MRILGFAHITISLPTRQKDLVDKLFDKELSYETIENNSKKLELMEFKDKLHHISLEMNGIEICLYDSASSTSYSKMREVLNAISSNGVSSVHFNFWLDARLITFLGLHGKMYDDEMVFRLESFPLMKSASFSKRTDSVACLITNRFLDTPGIASLAFYTDSILSKVDCEREQIDYLEPFKVCFPNRYFLVQILKIGGTNVELISRYGNH